MIDNVRFLNKLPAASVLPKGSGEMSAMDVTKTFGSFLNDALNQVQEQQSEVDNLNRKFVTGEVADVHQLMIAAEKASLGLELTVQIRNKAIEAYQEIMRTQI